jgi:hypothetical protein
MQSSLSLLSLLQYALLALVAYVLAGAPLLTLLSGDASGRQGAVSGGNASLVLERLAIPQPGLECEEHKFRGVHVLRTEPLVVYIEGFLSEDEAREIVDVRYVGGGGGRRMECGVVWCGAIGEGKGLHVKSRANPSTPLPSSSPKPAPSRHQTFVLRKNPE